MHLLAAAQGAVSGNAMQSYWLHACTPYSVPLGVWSLLLLVYSLRCDSSCVSQTHAIGADCKKA
jgi:hypothetical protein